MNLTKQPIFQKGQAAPKAPPKPMRKKAPAKPANDRGPFFSQTLRDFAEGKECQMKSEWCCGDPSKVVLCHSRRRAGAGTSQKPHDFWGYHGCSGCHANEHRIEDRELYDAIRRTQYAVFEHFGRLTP